jgi:hypothetical protein
MSCVYDKRYMLGLSLRRCYDVVMWGETAVTRADVNVQQSRAVSVAWRSFWSERNAGWLVRRLQSWTNPCYSIVKDYTKVDFIERARAMYPDVFRHKDTPLRHETKVLEEPDYLNDEIVVRLAGEGVAVALEAADQAALDSFLRENKYQPNSAEIRSHEQVVLNSFQIRTSAADSKVQTSDSVICARVKDGSDERYACLCVSRHMRTPRLVYVFHSHVWCVLLAIRPGSRLVLSTTSLNLRVIIHS